MHIQNNTQAEKFSAWAVCWRYLLKVSGKISVIVCVLALICTLAACGSTNADMSEYGDTPIVISGLTDEEFVITPRELAEFECVSRTASGKTAKAGTVNATGPLLDTFLAQYGTCMSDFERIRFIASDNYRVVLKDEYLAEYEVVLAISNGNKPLIEAHRPLRILIPDADSSMWEYAVVRIEFVT